MARVRRTRGRARRVRRRPVGILDRKFSVNDIANAAWSGVKQIRQLINVEKFKFDVGPQTSSPTTTPVIADFTAIAQGDGLSARTGTSILVHTVTVKGALAINGSATVSFFRLILVRDTQQVGDTAPAYTDVMETASTVALLNKNTPGRFQLLFDQLYVLGSASTQSIPINFHVTVQKHTKYNGTGSSDIQKGGIYMMMVSSEATNAPAFTYHGRLCYYDN